MEVNFDYTKVTQTLFTLTTCWSNMICIHRKWLSSSPRRTLTATIRPSLSFNVRRLSLECTFGFLSLVSGYIFAFVTSFITPLWTLPKAPRPSSSMKVTRSCGTSSDIKWTISFLDLNRKHPILAKKFRFVRDRTMKKPRRKNGFSYCVGGGAGWSVAPPPNKNCEGGGGQSPPRFGL